MMYDTFAGQFGHIHSAACNWGLGRTASSTQNNTTSNTNSASGTGSTGKAYGSKPALQFGASGNVHGSGWLPFAGSLKSDQATRLNVMA